MDEVDAALDNVNVKKVSSWHVHCAYRTRIQIIFLYACENQLARYARTLRVARAIFSALSYPSRISFMNRPIHLLVFAATLGRTARIH